MTNPIPSPFMRMESDSSQASPISPFSGASSSIPSIIPQVEKIMSRDLTTNETTIQLSDGRILGITLSNISPSDEPQLSDIPRWKQMAQSIVNMLYKKGVLSSNQPFSPQYINNIGVTDTSARLTKEHFHANPNYNTVPDYQDFTLAIFSRSRYNGNFGTSAAASAAAPATPLLSPQPFRAQEPLTQSQAAQAAAPSAPDRRDGQIAELRRELNEQAQLINQLQQQQRAFQFPISSVDESRRKSFDASPKPTSEADELSRLQSAHEKESAAIKSSAIKLATSLGLARDHLPSSTAEILTACSESIEKSSSAAQKQNARINELTTRLEKSERNYNQVLDAMDAGRKNLDLLKTTHHQTLETERKKYQQLETQLRNLQSEYATKFTTQSRNLENITIATNALAHSVRAKEDDIKSRESKLHDQNSRIIALESELKKLETTSKTTSEATISSLKETLSHANSVATKLEIPTAVASEDPKDLKSKIESQLTALQNKFKTLNEQFERERNKLNEDKRNLESEKAKLQEAATRDKLEIDRQKSELQKLQTELKSKTTVQKEEVASFASSVEQLAVSLKVTLPADHDKNNLAHLQNLLTRAKEKADADSKELTGLREQFASLQKSTDNAATASQTTISTLKAEHEKQVADLQSKISALAKKLDVTLTSTKTDTNALKSSLDQLRSELDKKNSEITALNDRLQKLANVEKENGQLADRIKELTATMATMKSTSEVDSRMREAEAITAELAVKQNTIEERDRTIAQLRDELNAGAEGMNATNETLTSIITDQKKQLDQQSEKIKQLETDLKNLHEIEAKIAQYEKEKASLKHTTAAQVDAQVTAKTAELQKKIDLLTAAKKLEEVELHKKDAELKALKEKLEKYESQSFERAQVRHLADISREITQKTAELDKLREQMSKQLMSQDLYRTAYVNAGKAIDESEKTLALLEKMSKELPDNHTYRDQIATLRHELETLKSKKQLYTKPVDEVHPIREPLQMRNAHLPNKSHSASAASAANETPPKASKSKRRSTLTKPLQPKQSQSQPSTPPLTGASPQRTSPPTSSSGSGSAASSASTTPPKSPSPPPNI